MVWADRLAVLWCIVVVLILVGMTGGDGGEIGRLIGPWFLFFCLPVWLLLRLLDWVFRGTSRRKPA